VVEDATVTDFTAADSTAVVGRGATYTGQVDAAGRAAAATPASSKAQVAASNDTVVLSTLALEALGDLGTTGVVPSSTLGSVLEAAGRFTDGTVLLDALNTQRAAAVSLLQAMPQPTVSIGDGAALLLQATRLAGMEQMLSTEPRLGLTGNTQLFPALAEADAVSLLLQAVASEPASAQGTQSGGLALPVQSGQAQATAAASSSTLQALVAAQASAEAEAVTALLPVLLESVALSENSFLSSVFFASGLRPSITLPGLLLSGSALTSVATALETALSGTQLTDTQKAALLNAFNMLQAEGETSGATGGTTGAASGLYAPPALYHPAGTNWPLYNQISQAGLPLPESPAELAASMTMEAVAYESALHPGVFGDVRRHEVMLYGQAQQGLPLSSLEEMGRTAASGGDTSTSLALAALMSGLDGGGAAMEAASFSNAMLNSTVLTSVINAGWTVLLSGYQFRLYPPYVRRRRNWWRRLRVWRTSPTDPDPHADEFYGGGFRSDGYTA
jgi:hypothetical protein